MVLKICTYNTIFTFIKFVQNYEMIDENVTNNLNRGRRVKNTDFIKNEKLRLKIYIQKRKIIICNNKKQKLVESVNNLKFKTISD